MNNIRFARYGAALMLAASALVACGSNGSGGGGSALSVSVSQPAAGASVTVPFTVTLTSSVPLGAENTGLHHVHLYFDDNMNDYLVVRATTVQVTNAPPGAHTMHISLRNANHSAAGAESQVALIIGGAPGPSPGPSSSTVDETDPPYRY